jgi:ribonuclease BN (tRNA processing enzyme)
MFLRAKECMEWTSSMKICYNYIDNLSEERRIHMRLTILGNNGPYPAPGGACSGYLLSSDSGRTTILLECGTGVLSRLSQYTDLNSIDAVILSHLHYDHMSDMLPLHYALQFNPRKRPLDVYTPAQPAEVRSLLKGNATDVWPMRETVVGEMKISFCPVRHPVETYAVSVECDGARFVYTGDSNTDFALELFCDSADFLLADAGLSSADHTESSPHLSAALCGKLAKDTGAKRLLLTHFNPKYNPDDLCAEAREYYPSAEIALCGESYYI